MQAQQQAAASSAPITAADIQRYQNPYTQQVVDATTAQMHRDFGQQHAQLQGNQIAQGALGGNATGVAKAILAGQQGRQLASTTSGLYQQSYQQAVDAARSQQQAGLAGANALANYGIGGQNAGLQAAQLQYGLGTQMQGTSQADLDRMYQQYAQAQAYPYQRTQWLAGMATGVGSNLGGTSSSTGTSTGPQPNQMGQYLGAGLTAASMFLSDRDAKTNIEKIGQTNDGQNIYRYQYRGSPEWHIGLIAQEVDDEHTARGGDGYEYVDLKGATDDAVERASGGGVQSPWGGTGGGVVGWIPQIGIHAGQGAPGVGGGGGGGGGGQQGGGFDPTKMAEGIVGVGKGLQSKLGLGGYGSGIGGGEWYGPSSVGGAPLSGYEAMVPNSFTGVGAQPYATGGGVVGIYDDPNRPVTEFGEGGDRFTVEPTPMRGNQPVVQLAPRSANFNDRFAGEPRVMDDPSIPVTEFGESGLDPNVNLGVVNPGNPVRMVGSTFGPEPPAGAPVVAEDEDEAPAAPGVAGRMGGAGRPPVMAFEDSEHYRSIPDAVSQPDNKGFGLGLLSKNAQTGLMAAGLGMMASRSPFLGNMVGEGGIAGLGTYARAEDRDRQIAAEAQKLSMEARKQAYDRWMGERKQTEAERHNVATEEKTAADKLPPGTMLDAKGNLVNRPGYIRAMEERTKAKASGASMDDETAEFLAHRVLAGDTKALVGLGRGAQGAENLAKINGIVARLAKEGTPVNDAARNILQNAAQQQGLIAAERTQANIMAKLSVYGRTAFKATDIALNLSKEVPRTDFQPINKVLNAARTKTGDPKIVALGQALMTLTNEYARAIGGGHGTVHDKEAAEKRLSEAQSHAQLEAVIKVMRQEILAEESAMPEAREHIRNIYNPRKGAGDHSISGEFGHKPPPGPVTGASGTGMVEGRTGKINGRPVVVKGGKLIYSDTGEAAP